MIRLDPESLLQGQTRTAKLKSAYNSRIIGPRDLECEEYMLLNMFVHINFQFHQDLVL